MKAKAAAAVVVAESEHILKTIRQPLRRPVFVDKWVLRRSAASVGAVFTIFLPHRLHFELYRVNSSRSSQSSHFLAVNMTAAVHYSKLFLCTQACSAACYHRPVFIDLSVLRRSAGSVGAVPSLFLCHRSHFDLYRVSSSSSS